MTDLLQVLGGRIESVWLTKGDLDDATVAGFAKAIEGIKLKTERAQPCRKSDEI